MPTFDILRREADIRSFKKGETIFKDGDPGDCMFVVVEGAVEIHLAGTVVERLDPGSLFGEMALIDGQVRSATAVAAADCSLAAINEKRFLRLVEITPRFALQVMQVITERLRRKAGTGARQH
jgi:CRP/FNR family transcriptional regulator, cyclic AMP receptor protein